MDSKSCQIGEFSGNLFHLVQKKYEQNNNSSMNITFLAFYRLINSNSFRQIFTDNKFQSKIQNLLL